MPALAAPQKLVFLSPAILLISDGNDTDGLKQSLIAVEKLIFC